MSDLFDLLRRATAEAERLGEVDTHNRQLEERLARSEQLRGESVAQWKKYADGLLEQINDQAS